MIFQLIMTNATQTNTTNKRPRGVLTLIWYTYTCLPFGVLFRKNWYIDGVYLSQTKAPNLHKSGVF